MIYLYLSELFMYPYSLRKSTRLLRANNSYQGKVLFRIS